MTAKTLKVISDLLLKINVRLLGKKEGRVRAPLIVVWFTVFEPAPLYNQQTIFV